MPLGVLALQGDVEEHLAALRASGAQAVEVRSAAELEGVEGLILPGGESTTIGKLMQRFGILEPLRARAAAGLPLWGTCAGMILLARHIERGLPDQPSLALMDIVVERNAFGRQVDSFETPIAIPALGPVPFPAVFIRAPVAREAGPGVEVLARHRGRIVAARQGNLLATAFHPELTRDTRMHAYFLEMTRQALRVGAQSTEG
ncbi:MAG TPA: pyridoxal 5'-phosphate synthase glutaminase subunit PdxT [Candidatus Nitrosotenuis sp.]|jgi:5'-phosphate synthase pdxT subunit|nr:pyridoxal 5'-phosphate synthase glutaminase subunit PdxT [Candidatus Nitrosotenuis sp.]